MDEAIRKLPLRGLSLALVLVAMAALREAFKIEASEVASEAIVAVVFEEVFEAIEVDLAAEEASAIRVIAEGLALVVLLLARLAVLEADVVATVARVATTIGETVTVVVAAIVVQAAVETGTTTVIGMGAVVDVMKDTTQGNVLTTATNTTIDRNDDTRELSFSFGRRCFYKVRDFARAKSTVWLQATFTNCINCLYSYSSTVCWWV